MPKKPKPKVHVVDLVEERGHPAKAEDKSKIISDAMQFAAFAAEALNLQNQSELTVLISRNEQGEPVFILQPPTSLIINALTSVLSSSEHHYTTLMMLFSL